MQQKIVNEEKVKYEILEDPNEELPRTVIGTIQYDGKHFKVTRGRHDPYELYWCRPNSGGSIKMGTDHSALHDEAAVLRALRAVVTRDKSWFTKYGETTEQNSRVPTPRI